MEDLQFTIKNTYDKKIIFLLLILDFPETEAPGQPGMAYPVKIGLGLNPTPDEKKFVKPIEILPGEDFVWTLSSQDLSGIKGFLSHKNFKLFNLNRVEILMDYVGFDDGTKWDHGYFYKPSPNTSSGYERIVQ